MTHFGVTQDRIDRANSQVGYVILRNGYPTGVKNARTMAGARKNLALALDIGILSPEDQWTNYTIEKMTGLEYLRLAGRYLGL